jgi:uncharacterized protein
MIFLFEWNPEKALSNFTKHNVRFETAASIFRDPLALSIFDDEHSDLEDRWITIGTAQNSQLLVVVHTFNLINNDDAVIRIISARKATKKETNTYRGEL